MIRRTTSNAQRLALTYRQRQRRFAAAIKRGLRRIGVMVNTQQVLNLSGSGSAPPGSYPVPVRTGNLRRESNWRIPQPNAVVIRNTADYAITIHRDRPYLHEAADSVDPSQVMAVEVSGAWR